MVDLSEEDGTPPTEVASHLRPVRSFDAACPRTDRTPPSRARSTVTFLLALVIGVVFPATSYWPLLLLVLTDPVVRRLRRTRVARSRNGS